MIIIIIDDFDMQSHYPFKPKLFWNAKFPYVIRLLNISPLPHTVQILTFLFSAAHHNLIEMKIGIEK